VIKGRKVEIRRNSSDNGVPKKHRMIELHDLISRDKHETSPFSTGKEFSPFPCFPSTKFRQDGDEELNRGGNCIFKTQHHHQQPWNEDSGKGTMG